MGTHARLGDGMTGDVREASVPPVYSMLSYDFIPPTLSHTLSSVLSIVTSRLGLRSIFGSRVVCLCRHSSLVNAIFNSIIHTASTHVSHTCIHPTHAVQVSTVLVVLLPIPTLLYTLHTTLFSRLITRHSIRYDYTIRLQCTWYHL